MQLMELSLALLALAAFAQDEAADSGKPADPISDRMHFEIAIAQRDYLVAKQQFDQATAQIREKLAEAEKACGEKRFDPQSFTCVEKPK